MKLYSISLFLLLKLCLNVNAQHKSKNITEISFENFLELTVQNNFSFLMENYEVSMAEAAYKAAKVFQNPELEIILPQFYKDDFSGFPNNISFEMEIPVELFGKRKNRIRQAEAEKFAARSMFDDYLLHLRADVASVFINMISKQLILEHMDITLTKLNQLTEINQILFEAGEIGEIDVIKTRLEARNFETEIFALKAEMAEIMSEVYYLIGGIPSDSIVFKGSLDGKQSILSFSELMEQAVHNRPDVVAANHMVNAARFNMQLARSERLPNISLIAGYHNEGALRPMPGLNHSYVGMIIPLQFSGLNRGELSQSIYRYEQSKLASQAVALTVENELKKSYDTYLIMAQKRKLFSEEILKDSERVRDAVLFSYQRGEVSLLELMEAQRTMNDTYMNFYQTLSDYYFSLIDLSKESGLWLVEL